MSSTEVQAPAPLVQAEQAIASHFEDCLLSLTATRPQEIGGARATARFDYQKNWTLYLILELHGSQQDYLIICDYFDDVIALLKRQDALPGMRFYQVKGVRRHWTPTALTEQESGANDTKLPSILGKLLAHHGRFKKNVESVNFVSNQHVNIKLTQDPTTAERTQFEYGDISDEDRKKLEKKLVAELGCSEEFIRKASLVFIRTPLNLDDHDVHIRGYLEQFLRKTFGDHPYPIYSIHLVISDEIMQRIKDQGVYSDTPSLTTSKGFSRQQFDSLLQSLVAAQKRSDPKSVIEAVTQNLQDSGIAHGEKKSIVRELMRFAGERALTERTDLRGILQRCRAFLDWISSSTSYESMNYIDILNAGVRFLREDKSINVLAFSDTYLKAVVSWEEYCHEPIPSAAP